LAVENAEAPGFVCRLLRLRQAAPKDRFVGKLKKHFRPEGRYADEVKPLTADSLFRTNLSAIRL
jgi:hypothetical protein